MVAQKTTKTDKTTQKKSTGRTCSPKTAVKKETATVKKDIVKKENITAPKKAVKKQKPVKVPPRTTALSQEQVKELLSFVVHKLDEGKAEEILSLDLAGKTSFADYLVIATGTSSRHVFGLANNLATDLKKAGYRVQVSGDTGDGQWVVIDVIDIVIHLFTKEAREFYKLEEIWK
ncbi:MAG: ribosome silencing factor [Alphaproteobacteria bacterium]|nr:ribosome silencing factor [Alphaproteobacteria bacterium]MBQ8557555.1 ribosome silencing factor [Alphaproteobacteria bacterium]MBR3912623.1 ribosome silencing factor [Alphaproteobacteria bacterium]